MANKTIGQASAHTDTAILISDPIALNATTSTTILAAEAIVEGQDPERMLIVISITGQDAFVRLQPAAVDNTTKKGIFVPKNTTIFINVDAMYFGEISAISNMAQATAYVTVL